jgi:hypothetical protein
MGADEGRNGVVQRRYLWQRSDLIAVKAEALHIRRNGRKLCQAVGVEGEPAEGGDGGELGADGGQVAVVEREIIQVWKIVSVELVRQHLSRITIPDTASFPLPETLS